MGDLRETDLYEPIKRFLEGQGYTVKGEIGRCDLVAAMADAEPVVVELKLAFNLALIFQGIQRQTLTDLVYIAVPSPRGRTGVLVRQRKHALKLCRMLGLGLMSVDVASGHVEIMLDPAAYVPRKQPRARQRLLGEFQRRVGDPTRGGGRGRPVMTAYRQDALRCAIVLSRNGPTSPAELRKTTGVERAGTILQRDVYGWFERVERGVYQITPNGETALLTFADVAMELSNKLQ